MQLKITVCVCMRARGVGLQGSTMAPPARGLGMQGAPTRKGPGVPALPVLATCCSLLGIRRSFDG